MKKIIFLIFVSLFMFSMPFSAADYNQCTDVDLSSIPIYKTDKVDRKCDSWTMDKSSGYFKVGCNQEWGAWRAYGIKAVDVSGVDTLRVKYDINSTSSTVHYDDYANLVVFTEDKTSELSGCGGSITTEQWGTVCNLTDMETDALGSCGLPAYESSQSCDFIVDVSGLDTVYLTFIGKDAWNLAFGVLQYTFDDVQVCTSGAGSDDSDEPQDEYNILVSQIVYDEDDDAINLRVYFPEGNEFTVTIDVTNEDGEYVNSVAAGSSVFQFYPDDTSSQAIAVPVQWTGNGDYFLDMTIVQWDGGNETVVYSDHNTRSVLYAGAEEDDTPYCGNNICEAGETCTSDDCCSGVIKDLQTDPYNCGACGSVCELAETCESGICEEYTACGDALCSAGETCAADNCCNGIHKELETDENNCGWCGNVCASGEECVNGLCKSTVPPNFEEALEEMECTGDCERAVTCANAISAEVSCATEVADIIPIIDKPAALVLLADDLCDIKHRLIDNWDLIGAAGTTVLMLIDFVDNIPDVVTVGAGYVVTVPIDVIEGSVDCMEGLIYEHYLDDCGGYTWCVLNLMKQVALSAVNLGRQSVNAAWSLVFSPATIEVVDDHGNRLGIRDGVFVFSFGDFKAVMVKEPQQITGGYNLELTGTDSGTYNLETVVVGTDGEVIAQLKQENAPVSSGQKDYYKVIVPSSLAADAIIMTETVLQAPVDFSDLDETHWSYNIVMNLVNFGVIKGYADGTFKPDNPITRAELLKIAFETFDLDIADNDAWTEFNDVEAMDWFKDYIAAALTFGLTEGYSDGGFHPHQNITRAEALKIIMGVASHYLIEEGKTLNFEIMPKHNVPDFSDVDSYAWYASLVEDAVAFDLAKGYSDNTFRPNNPITRAEASKIIILAKELIDDYKIDLSEVL